MLCRMTYLESARYSKQDQPAMSRKTTSPINRRHMSSIAQPPEIADMLRLRGSDKVYS